MKFLPLMLVFAALLIGACAAAPREIWIGVRHDGQEGAGSRADPFDGSTQPRFDGLLRRYWQQGVEGLSVNLLPGVYKTVGNGDYIAGLRGGDEGWRCNSGWTISGSGQDRTILRLMKIYKHPGGDIYSACGISTTDSSVSGVTVQDLTVDCNHTAIGNAKSTEGGVGLRGTGHTIRRVTVENVAGLGYEGFPIFIGSNGLDSSNNLIENCLIRGWKGGTGGSITLANNLNNGHPPKTWTSGIIRNNRVEGTHIGYGGWGMRGVVFEHNVAEGCAFGSNIDSLGNRGVRFTGNQFLNCTSYGMVFAQCHKFQIAGNTITLAGGGPYLFFLNDVSDFFVTDNTFRSASGHPEMAGLRDAATATGKFVFSGNTSTPPAPVNLPASLLAPQ